MDLNKYPVTTPFGWVAGYPLNQTDPVNHAGQGFHNGIDYGLPMNTPVIVNGVEIGRSNATGSVTGPHLHIGKYQNGAAQNGGIGNGARFNSARVFDTGYDAVNGYFVRITGDGALWNYLHLAKDSIKVSAGQVLNGGSAPQGDDNMITKDDVGPVRIVMSEVEGWDGNSIHSGKNDAQIMGWVGHSWPEFITHGFTVQNTHRQNLVDALTGRDKVIVGLQEQIKKLGETPVTGGSFTDADRATANETNNVVKQIWQKLTSIFK